MDFRKVLIYQISRKSVHYKLSCSMQTDIQADGHAWRRYSRFS